MQKELHIKLILKASSNRVVVNNGDHSLKVYVTAVPEHGKANEAMIELLSAHFHSP